MKEADFFVMDYFPGSKNLGEDWLERGKIQKAAGDWIRNIVDQCQVLGVRLNLRTIENEAFEDGLDFTVRARKYAFEESQTEQFILSDNDMLPFTADQVARGIDLIGLMSRLKHGFSILSAWPEPHVIKPISTLPDRDVISTDDVMEHYACGGFRFCSKVGGEMDPPQERKHGYDGLFCRYLWDKHRRRVGYLKNVRAFHLGTHCTSLWGKDGYSS